MFILSIQLFGCRSGAKYCAPTICYRSGSIELNHTSAPHEIHNKRNTSNNEHDDKHVEKNKKTKNKQAERNSNDDKWREAHQDWVCWFHA